MGLAGLRKGGALGSDDPHEYDPRIDKRFGPIILEPCGQLIYIDARRTELAQYRFAIAPIDRHDLAEIPVIGERFQRSLGHRVYRERRSQRLDIKHIGRLGVLGSRARPQQPLRTGAGVIDPLPPR